MDTVSHHIDLIVSNPKIRSGRPVIAGTTLCVSDIAIQKIVRRTFRHFVTTGLRSFILLLRL
jgi:Protein of unknown function (DUF433)